MRKLGASGALAMFGMKMDGRRVSLPKPPRGHRWVLVAVEKTLDDPADDFRRVRLQFELVTR